MKQNNMVRVGLEPGTSGLKVTALKSPGPTPKERIILSTGQEAIWQIKYVPEFPYSPIFCVQSRSICLI